MEKRIIAYVKGINEILNADEPDTDWDDIMSDHLNQISFFQHERLIHLMVTITFGFLLVLAAMFILVFGGTADSASVYILFGVILVTLVFYIRHYYYLENNVQKLYEQYDKVFIKKNPKKAANRQIK